MYGTVDLFTCTFDTVNHLENGRRVQKLFNRVSLFLDPNGLFIFDMNTRYKHKNILGNQIFDFVEPEADCHWENTLCDDEHKTKISISIDDKVSGGHYHEEFFEHYYEYDEILSMLKTQVFVFCRFWTAKHTKILQIQVRDTCLLQGGKNKCQKW